MSATRTGATPGGGAAASGTATTRRPVPGAAGRRRGSRRDGGRWTGWRAAVRIARRDALRARGRTALVAAMVALPVLVGSAGGVLVLSMQTSVARQVTEQLGPSSQARVWPYSGQDLIQSVNGLGAQSSGPSAEVLAMDLADYERGLAAALPDGDALVRVAVAAGATEAGGRRLGNTAVSELPTDVAEVAALWPVVDGRLPEAAGEVAVTSPVLAGLDVALGDTVAVAADGAEPVELTVVGEVENPYDAEWVVAVPGALLAPPATVGETVDGSVYWYVTGPTPVTWPDVQAVNAVGSRVFSRAVVLDPPPDAEVPYAEFEAGSEALISPTTVAMIGAVAAMGLLEAVLLIGPAFAVGAMRSERQLALLAATGAERRTLSRVVLSGGLVIGLAASAAAVVLGVVVAAAFRVVVEAANGPQLMPDLRVPWPALVGLVLLGTAIAMAAAWLPARRAARVDVVAALAGRRTQVRHRRWLSVLGVALMAAGTAVAALGATRSIPTAVVGGVLLLEIGVVVASGGVIALVGRIAPVLGVAGRLAARDAVRQRARTAPAVAAVVAALAGAVGGMVFLNSDQERIVAQYVPFAAEGTVDVWVPGADGLAMTAADWAAVDGVLREELPVTAVVPLRRAVPPGMPIDGSVGASLSIERVEENLCPFLTGDDVSALSAAELTAVATDPRCPTRERNGHAWPGAPAFLSAPVVDDGTAMTALGLESSSAAAEALRAGKAVVAEPYDLRPDGTVRLVIRISAPDGEEVSSSTVDLPAVAATELPVGIIVILPPSLLDEAGLAAVDVGLAASVSAVPDAAQEHAATAAVGGVLSGAYLRVERGPSDGSSTMLWILVVAALVVGVGATAVSVALAAAESRADLATLSAVGAGPRVRRRVAAAQAAVIAVTGAVLGLAAGLLLGWVLVLAERFRYILPDLDWAVVMPWPAVAALVLGLPALTVAGAWVFTPSKLVMVRRIE